MNFSNFLFFTIVISIFLFTSCSKDEPSLASTTWNLQLSDGSFKLSFFSDTTYLLVGKQGAIEKLRTDGKYIYAHPSVNMNPFVSSIFQPLKGTINGNKMKVINDRTGADFGEFVKEK